MNTISLITANYVAREVGWMMHGWAHGDRATNDAFRPPETFATRFSSLLDDVCALGFDTVDVWGAHLSPEWATDEQVATALTLLDERHLGVGSYQVWVGKDTLERACEIAAALRSASLSGNVPLSDARLESLLARHALRFAYENHPEKTPREVLEKLPHFAGVCVDTGWFGTHGYDAARAIEELGRRVFHVHLKDVRAVGEPHETCVWGEGVVDVEACVRALREIGYGERSSWSTSRRQSIRARRSPRCAPGSSSGSHEARHRRLRRHRATLCARDPGAARTTSRRGDGHRARPGRRTGVGVRPHRASVARRCSPTTASTPSST